MPAQGRHVYNTLLTERRSGPNILEIHYTTDEGKNYIHGMPESAPSHYAAAYGVDMGASDAADQILDIILHQHHIPDPTLPANRESDVAAKLGFKTRIVNHREYMENEEVPITLYTAESTAQAREVHMLRIAEVKKKFLYVPFTEVPAKNLRSSAAQMFHMTELEKGKVGHPYGEWRKNHGVTEESLEYHQAYVEVMRAHARGKQPADKFLTRISRRREQPDTRPKQDAIVRQSLAIRINPV
ncbi:hypothetical protein [Streptomyces sp. NPDC006477]|uniref:hypothetical protein n=1 Tax=Streptomyces sp. NPDC006477 TaxID=3364747 RepID=UPI0036A72EB2